jgi:3-hydroxyanthranilate 3,4-dioxygenase
MNRPFNFQKWIEENRHLLKPPVGNKQVFTDNKDFIVMVVGGPNNRKDFHLNQGEEFFYQLEGEMTLKIVEDGSIVNLPMSAGDIYLLPPNVPHSPQRKAGSVGLVVERYRADKEEDGFVWYCENCGNNLFEVHFELTDIVTQLPKVMEQFYSSEELRTCDTCRHVMEPPKAVAAEG